MRNVAARRLHHRLLPALKRFRRRDGGFPTSVDGESEVEPTVVAALALRDTEARRWLTAQQRADGGFDERDGRASSPASAALAALALEGAAARAALAFVLAQGGRLLPGATGPHSHVGWGWASNPDDARSLVEPTARVLTAVKAVNPADRDARAEAVDVLERLRCADGGWNYGTATVNEVDLRAYAQTTAIALIGLQGETESLVAPALRFLRRSYRLEPGGMTAAQALLAFRLHGVDDELTAAVQALESVVRTRSFLERPAAVAWAALATGPDALIEPLRSRA
jgi:hypothetical protein